VCGIRALSLSMQMLANPYKLFHLLLFIIYILVVVISLINSIPETEWSKSRSAFCDV
jgi:hypothetical protein